MFRLRIMPPQKRFYGAVHQTVELVNRGKKEMTMSLKYESTKKNKDGSVTKSREFTDGSGRKETTRNGKVEERTIYPRKK